jgi:hypothetical protein
MGRLRKKLRRQGAQILRNEAYIDVRRNDEGCSATPHPDFLRSRQVYMFAESMIFAVVLLSRRQIIEPISDYSQQVFFC